MNKKILILPVLMLIFSSCSLNPTISSEPTTNIDPTITGKIGKTTTYLK